MKLQDLLKDIELGKVYTDKDRKPFKVNEGMKRFKVYVSGEKEPLILLGKNEKEVKQVAHQMIQNSSVKVRKVVKEGLDEAGYMGGAIDMTGLNTRSYTAPKRDTEKGGTAAFLQKFSSKEARAIVDGNLKMWAKELRKVQYKIIKDWMSAAKAGKIDFFDIIRGLKTGDVRRAHSFETDFLVSVLTRDKIIDRFRKYFGGKKGLKSRTK